MSDRWPVVVLADHITSDDKMPHRTEIA